MTAASEGSALAPESRESRESRTRRDAETLVRLAAVFAVVLLAVLLYGGYALGWSWTGFGDNDHLWDYLQLLVLPVVLTALPLWLRTHHEASTRWRIVIGGVLVTFAVLLVGGYGLGWEWTGFAPKALWDWLDLLILPVVLSTMPLWLETHQRLESRWIAILAAVLVAFAILVVGGYGLGWTWTGFEGNTVWDWLHLLLVPFALPATLTWYQVSSRRARERSAVVDAAPRVRAEPEPAAEHGATAEAT